MLGCATDCLGESRRRLGYYKDRKLLGYRVTVILSWVHLTLMGRWNMTVCPIVPIIDSWILANSKSLVRAHYIGSSSGPITVGCYSISCFESDPLQV